MPALTIYRPTICVKQAMQSDEADEYGGKAAFIG